MKKALFLDRDGVINIDHGYVYQIEKFEWQPGIFELCRQAQQQGYLIIIITNQSGIARGYYQEKDLILLHEWMTNKFATQDIIINKIYYCPHHIDGIEPQFSFDCNCRKPKTGMFKQAIAEFNIDVSNSIMIGDKETDLVPAQNVGIRERIQFNYQPLYSSTTKHISSLKELIKM